MVAWKRRRESPEAAGPHPPAAEVERGGGDTAQPPAAAQPDNQLDSAMMPKTEVGDSRPTSASAPHPNTEDGLRQRLAELQHAEQVQQERYRLQQEQISRQFQGDGQQQQPTAQQQAIAKAQQEVNDWLAVPPGIVTDPQAIATSTRLVQQGYQLASPAWRDAMERNGFVSKDYSQQSAKPVVHQGPLATEEQPKPERLESEEQPMEEPEHRAEARYMSAPVSREGGVSLSGERSLSASSVRLSPDERHIARTSGISEVEYARQKIKLEQMKRQGFHQDG
jgi:hypothetical protein